MISRSCRASLSRSFVFRRPKSMAISVSSAACPPWCRPTCPARGFWALGRLAERLLRKSPGTPSWSASLNCLQQCFLLFVWKSAVLQKPRSLKVFFLARIHKSDSSGLLLLVTCFSTCPWSSQFCKPSTPAAQMFGVYGPSWGVLGTNQLPGAVRMCVGMCYRAYM